MLSAVWSNGADPALLTSLMRMALERALQRYPAETKLAIQAVNSRAAALLQALLPSCELISLTYRYTLPLAQTDAEE